MVRPCRASLIFLVIASTMLFASCRSTSGTEHDQIVKTAIELADKYYQGARYMDAISVYDRALEQADDYRLYFNKAIVLSTMGNHSEAAELCSRSFEKYPHIISFKKAQAAYLRLSHDNQGSYEAYSQILELDPYDTETRYILIEICLEDGLNEKAYENALILWNQGYHDSRTISYLHSHREEQWQAVYDQLNK